MTVQFLNFCTFFIEVFLIDSSIQNKQVKKWIPQASCTGEIATLEFISQKICPLSGEAVPLD